MLLCINKYLKWGFILQNKNCVQTGENNVLNTYKLYKLLQQMWLCHGVCGKFNYIRAPRQYIYIQGMQQIHQVLCASMQCCIYLGYRHPFTIQIIIYMFVHNTYIYHCHPLHRRQCIDKHFVVTYILYIQPYNCNIYIMYNVALDN